ncbi:MAG TPA: energy transducer TonB [Terracidiphilus sp.]|jgi:outer membrane biosynthesis protein TonB|nr:energy transducer TonB [Terracidiphilus sp.]
MRRLIVSTLFLSTVLLHGQTSTQGQSGTLEARNNTVNSMATDADIAPHAHRVTTGVIFPKLISGPKMNVSTTDFPTRDLALQRAIVSLRVDENGTPQNVRLVKSVNQTVDARVLAVVREYHYVPGSLDERNVPVDLNLIFNFQTK